MAWSTVEPSQMMRSFKRRWKISELASGAAPAATIKGGTAGLGMARGYPARLGLQAQSDVTPGGAPLRKLSFGPLGRRVWRNR